MLPIANCANCRAYKTLTNDCHRHAPVMHVVPTGLTMQVHGLFPPTKPESWCMEHAPIPMEVATS